jgi:hypothetical protein
MPQVLASHEAADNAIASQAFKCTMHRHSKELKVGGSNPSRGFIMEISGKVAKVKRFSKEKISLRREAF